ncbi:hypothetical protein L915_03638 [Phytophthora nicotianae]|uniref:Uncharacterized protein n=1 Tax=Phytophthora nicotianae TaxID=4792 RepID=W2HCZ3_PHYNI|nr:hypothetical protein L915_03638 [Phytophthora nicotianae]ETL46546.1 hypothetical protein L916_03578 [Phytophthora nicotianae]
MPANCRHSRITTPPTTITTQPLLTKNPLRTIDVLVNLRAGRSQRSNRPGGGVGHHHEGIPPHGSVNDGGNGDKQFRPPTECRRENPDPAHREVTEKRVTSLTMTFCPRS